MSVCYKKLWKLLIDKEISKTELRKKSKIAASTMAKMKNNQYVALEVLERICLVLNCTLDDIVEFSEKEEF